jgi:hypothetical protein
VNSLLPLDSSVNRDGAGPTQVYRVQIPHEVRPGQEFQVIAGTRTVRVTCPPESRGGQYLQISVPPDPIARPNTGMAVLTSATGQEGGGAVPMTAEVMAANEQQQRQQNESSMHHSTPSTPPTTYMVRFRGSSTLMFLQLPWLT